jgi:hypothetical protein
VHWDDHKDNPDLNCRGIKVGMPRNRNKWECDRWLEDTGYDRRMAEFEKKRQEYMENST